MAQTCQLKFIENLLISIFLSIETVLLLLSEKEVLSGGVELEHWLKMG